MTHPSVEEVLTRRIDARGRITFAEFMALVLYSPRGGYYSSLTTSGRAQDYFTAPSAHPAFGALLALQLEVMWRLLGCPQRFVVVEQGAGSGRLAKDINAYASHLDSSFKKALLYVAVERSVGAMSLDGNAFFQMVSAAGLPFQKLTGCILSNELLDALPVHRVAMRNGRVREIYVTHTQGRLLEIEDDPSTSLIEARLAEECVDLEEGQRGEVCLELEPWIHQVANVLEQGFVLTIDYGHSAQELYSSRRFHGTLRSYYHHTLAADPYIRVGEQDITAHVDFTAVEALGSKYGLCNQPMQTQASFLDNLGLRSFQRRLAASGLSQRERDANRMGMLELARPGGMGDFKVLVQRKSVAVPCVTGVQGASNEWRDRVNNLPLPLLGNEHLSLMEAKYPHTAQNWGEGWPWG